MLSFLLFLQATVLYTETVQPFYKCSLHVDIRVMLTHYILNGDLAVDSTTNSLFSSIYGDDPNNYWGKLNATVVVQPLLEGFVNIWAVDNTNCTSFSNVSVGNLPKYALPENATYLGTEVVDSSTCSVWRVNNPYHKVDYCDIFINKENVLLLEFPYCPDTVCAHFYVRMFNHDNSRPDSKWFRKPAEC